MRNAIFILTLFLFTQCTTKVEPLIVNLWQADMPLDNGTTEPEDLLGDGYLATNVSTPQLYIFKAKNNKTGKAVVICPGGGYEALAIGHEGTRFAEWLSFIGVTGIVLKYRVPNGHKDIPLADVQQAMRYVRQNAVNLGVDPQKIGIAGFSAGGHMASLACTHQALEGESTIPDFSIFFYPIITMNEFTHKDTRRQLMGDSLVQENLDFFSSELHVSTETPPAIIFLSDDDDQVDPMNSVLYYKALKGYNISAAMYAFPRGEHGWGMSPEHMKFRYYNEMLGLLEKWLNTL